MLVIDDREPAPVIDMIISTPIWEGTKIQIRRLEFCDFLFTFYDKKSKQWVDIAVWESKTVNDLVGSMSTKVEANLKTGSRLIKQMVKAQATGLEVGLIIKGRIDTWSDEIDPLDRKVLLGDYHKSGWSHKSIAGLQLSLMRRGVKVIQFDEPTDLPYYLRFLHKHYETHKKDTDNFWRSSSSVPTAMLDMIPGVGPITAQKVHDNLDTQPGSLSGVIEASKSQLENLVGPKLGNQIYWRFH